MFSEMLGETNCWKISPIACDLRRYNVRVIDLIKNSINIQTLSEDN